MRECGVLWTLSIGGNKSSPPWTSPLTPSRRRTAAGQGEAGPWTQQKVLRTSRLLHRRHRRGARKAAGFRRNLLSEPVHVKGCKAWKDRIFPFGPHVYFAGAYASGFFFSVWLDRYLVRRLKLLFFARSNLVGSFSSWEPMFGHASTWQT